MYSNILQAPVLFPLFMCSLQPLWFYSITRVFWDFYALLPIHRPWLLLAMFYHHGTGSLYIHGLLIFGFSLPPIKNNQKKTSVLNMSILSVHYSLNNIVWQICTQYLQCFKHCKWSRDNIKYVKGLHKFWANVISFCLWDVGILRCWYSCQWGSEINPLGYCEMSVHIAIYPFKQSKQKCTAFISYQLDFCPNCLRLTIIRNDIRGIFFSEPSSQSLYLTAHLALSWLPLTPACPGVGWLLPDGGFQLQGPDNKSPLAILALCFWRGCCEGLEVRMWQTLDTDPACSDVACWLHSTILAND